MFFNQSIGRAQRLASATIGRALKSECEVRRATENKVPRGLEVNWACARAAKLTHTRHSSLALYRAPPQCSSGREWNTDIITGGGQQQIEHQGLDTVLPTTDGFDGSPTRRKRRQLYCVCVALGRKNVRITGSEWCQVSRSILSVIYFFSEVSNVRSVRLNCTLGRQTVSFLV